MAEPPAAPAPYVFLSYASADREQALAIADALTATGIAVWLDRRSLVGGMSWDAAIVEAIQHCAVFAVLCTPAGVSSPNVMQELRLAWEEQRPTLPLRLAPVTFPSEMRYILAGRQWIEAADRGEAAWLPDLLNALAGMGAAASRTQTPAASAPPLPASPPTNLPAALTRLLGREQELTDLAQLLANEHVVTLTGPGGTGKTQLAISAAGVQAAAFPDGVFFVDLAPLQDPTLVPAAVGQSLGVQTLSEIPVRDSVLRFVRDKRLLLVLDNYEHLLAAAEFAGALLQAGPAVTLLVTSRAPLRVRGEREYAVSPLLVPEAGTRSAAQLGRNPAVQLFVLRAQAVRADFMLTAENAAAIAAICTRLDGLPLAIELAAARVRALPPAALLARLEQRLPLLTGGRRDLPARQQTLRDTIAWSYSLLDGAEQRLFRRLGVFAGGCTLELAESVCNADGDLGIDVLDGVSSLLEKSLLRETDGLAGEPRYRMLETIREFAVGELEASSEAEIVRSQLAVQVLQLVRQNAAANNWDRLDADQDNVRAVLGWCVERAELGLGVRLWWALRWYWEFRGGIRERGVWRQRLLALPGAAQPNISRARLLALTSMDALSAAEQARAAADLEEAIRLSRDLGDMQCLADALQSGALVRQMQGDFTAVVPLAEEALTLFLQLDNGEGAVVMRGFLTRAALARGDVSTAERLVAVNRSFAGTAGRVRSLLDEAQLAEARGDDAQAVLLLREYLQSAVTVWGGTSINKLFGLVLFARLRLRQGNNGLAVAACAEMLAVQRSGGPLRILPQVLTVVAGAAERCDLLIEGTCLLAAAGLLRRGESGSPQWGYHADYQAAVARLRGALGDAAFTEAWAEGEALSADASIEYGLEVVAQLQHLLATETVADSLR